MDHFRFFKPLIPYRKYCFTGGLLVLICCLCCFVYPLSAKLSIYSLAQKQNLLQELSPLLERTAVEQARTIFPTYSWVTFPEEYSEEVKTAIREGIISSNAAIQNADEENALEVDSNLAWLIDTGEHVIHHNWKDEYNTRPGILDIQYFSRNGKTESKTAEGSGLRSREVFLGKENTIVLPAGRDLGSQAGNGAAYQYTIQLPENFSIRFYVPSALNANGEPVAITAAGENIERYLLYAALGWMAVSIYVLIWRKDIETAAPIFKQFIQMKSFSCWLFLILSLGCLGILIPNLFVSISSGFLKDYLLALGLPFSQVKLLIPCAGYLAWFGYFFSAALCSFYIKYIFAFGITRYLREDTFFFTLVSKLEMWMKVAGQKGLTSWTWKKTFPILLLMGVLMFMAVMVGNILGGAAGAAVSIAVVIVLSLISLRRGYVLIMGNFTKTLDAANELVEGRFQKIQPQQVGAFQPLYDSLLIVRDEFQEALKEGLANQKMKTQLITNVSHDLKTPVTGIKSYSELISMAGSMEDVKNYSVRLNAYADRLSSLIDDLFDVAKATSGDIRLAPVYLNLAELTAQVVSEWEDTLAKKGMQVVCDLPDEAMTCLDPNKTMRIIDNLVSNVNKYALENTRIFVSLQNIPGHIVLVMKNISKTPLDFNPDEITERFTRGDKSRSEPGSGLGLAIVKSFMEIQNGTCSIETDGDVFKAILTFPVILPASEEEDKETRPTE